LIYLLDANVLIDANRDYYPIRRIPEFWEWLIFQGERNLVKIPIEVFEEIRNGNDELTAWINTADVKSSLLFTEQVDVPFVSQVVNEGYSANLTDDEVEKLGRDPFLIAYALKSSLDRIVVTTEASKPRRVGANRHVPDVCKSLGIKWCHTFQFIRDLNFSTDWKTNCETTGYQT
jgi:hypothetical protein